MEEALEKAYHAQNRGLDILGDARSSIRDLHSQPHPFSGSLVDMPVAPADVQLLLEQLVSGPVAGYLADTVCYRSTVQRRTQVRQSLFS